MRARLRSIPLSRAAIAAASAAVIACAPDDPARVEIELRPDDPRATSPRFDEDDAIERMASPGGRFLVHFTRDGAHAVPPDDHDEDGTPDFVAEVARAYDEALAHYEAAGFRAPLDDLGAPEGDGGDARFDVYLVDFAGSSTGAFRRDACGLGAGGACSGHVVQENDFAGYSFASRAEAIRILASHELFHAVQAAYDADQPAVFAEGSAVWATEDFAPETRDLEGFSRGYLHATERSLAQSTSGPVDPYAYGAGVFFLFLAERHGPALLRTVLEDVEDGARGVDQPVWLEALGAALARDHGSSFDAAWLEHAQWNVRTGRFADPDTSYARGESIAELAPLAIELPHRDDRARILRASARYFEASPGARARVAFALVAPPDRPEATEDLWVIAGTRRAGEGAILLVRSAREGALEIDAPPAGPILFAIVRGLGAPGDSSPRVPAICIGDPDEVAACRAAVEGSSSDAGALIFADAGPGDAGAPPSADAGAPARAEHGCACRAGHLRAAAPSLLSRLALASLLALAIRRNRRAG